MSEDVVEANEPNAGGTDNRSVYAELGEMVDAQRAELERSQRLRVVEGLTDVKAGRINLGESYRLAVTAAVQASPVELGNWLYGEGQGFRGVDRPVNTSLIDQDHNWTFGGENGYIIAPSNEGSDIIAAKPHDIGSNDLELQPIEVDAKQLLASTDPKGYNQVNLAAGSLIGVYIRQDEQGNDLGSVRINSELRAFAETHDLPVVEIPVRPQELVAGPVQVSELEAKQGNRLWKIRIPEDGEMYEIDVIQVQPGEAPRGMQLDEDGYDLRIQQIDAYGGSTFINGKPEALAHVREVVEGLPREDYPGVPMGFVLSRMAA